MVLPPLSREVGAREVAGVFALGFAALFAVVARGAPETLVVPLALGAILGVPALRGFATPALVLFALGVGVFGITTPPFAEPSITVVRVMWLGLGLTVSGAIATGAGFGRSWRGALDSGRGRAVLTLVFFLPWGLAMFAVVLKAVEKADLGIGGYPVTFLLALCVFAPDGWLGRVPRWTIGAALFVLGAGISAARPGSGTFLDAYALWTSAFCLAQVRAAWARRAAPVSPALS